MEPNTRFDVVNALIDQSVDDDLSEAADILGRELFGIILPAGFTTADLTFFGSVDNVTFFQLNDEDDGVITWAGCEASHLVLKKYDTPRILGFRYLKVAVSVAQAADRNLILLVGN